MVELILAVALALAALIAFAWIVGAREQVFANTPRGAGWFVALKRAAPFAPSLAPGVLITWSSGADFAFIGASDPYWTDFFLLSGEANPPLQLDASVEDAFIARVNFGRPPPLALGMLRLLTRSGLLSRPAGAVLTDAQALGHRQDVMPAPDAIATLLARPPSYAPAMVNFLAYKPGKGARAYARYGRVAMRTVYRTGGRLLFFGRIAEIVRAAGAGPCVGRWDDVAAMQYPRPQAILSMEQVPEYRAALVHRDAGLERTIVIASTPGGAP